MAGIPSTVYGFFALTFMTPLIKQVIPGASVFNALSASIAVGTYKTIFAVGSLFLIILMYRILSQGLPYINFNFLSGLPSRRASQSGILPALVGRGYTLAITALMAVPLGVGTAIYLEEYAPKKVEAESFLQLNIANLAGIPSIVYGMLGLAVFVKLFSSGRGF